MKNEKPRMNSLLEDEVKFIQVYFENEPYIRFAEDKLSYHCLILSSFVKEFDLKYQTRESEFGMGQIVSEIGENYKLVGAGTAKMIDNKIVLFGGSSDYCLKASEEHLESFLKYTKQDFEIKARIYG